ncbi:MAG: hypothetical protein ACSHXF_14395 [Aquaticitalea sp.]
MEKEYKVNDAGLNGSVNTGAMLNGIASNNALYAAVKKIPAAPAVVESNVNVEPQKDAPVAKAEADAPEMKKKGRSRETGHGINLRNFGRIVDSVIGIGADYINNNVLLTLIALQAVYDAANLAITKLSQKMASLSAAIDLQVSEYADLKKTCTMAVRLYETSGVSKKAIDQLRNKNALIQGYRIIKAKVDDLNLKSVSHQSYAQLAIHFEAFIQILELDANYNPGNPNLATSALRAKHDRMVAKYRAVEMARTEAQNARIDRDVTLYKSPTGLVDIAYAVKKTYLSLFGSRSPIYKQISGLDFRKFGDYKNL